MSPSENKGKWIQDEDGYYYSPVNNSFGTQAEEDYAHTVGSALESALDKLFETPKPPPQPSNPCGEMQKKKRIRKPDPKIIRINDNVEIVIPEVFERVGYPLTKQAVINNMTKEQKQSVWEMLAKVGLEVPLNPLTPAEELVPYYGTTYEKILDILASILIRKQKWGGSERKIYTRIVPEIAGKTAKVKGKKVVRTGFYNPSHTYAWGDEPDYDPAYLSQEKAHVIYELDLWLPVHKTPLEQLVSFPWIEQRCVKKVMPNDNAA